MARQIKGNDIIQDNHLDNAIKSGELLLKTYKDIDAQLQKMAKTAKAGLGSVDAKSAKGIKELNLALSESEKKKKAVIKIDKERANLEVKLKALNSDKIQQNEQLKVLAQEQAKVNKQLAREATGLVGAYEKESKTLIKLRKQLKDLILVEGEGSKKTKQLAAEVNKLDARLKKADSAAGQFQRNVGNYKSGLKGAIGSVKKLAMAFGLFGGIQLAIRGIRNMFNVVKNFEQGTADLSSVLGVNIDQMEKLTTQSKELGATTIFTASQVSELQKEYAKLGFTIDEIEGVTEATLQLAAATGSDLGQSATVVGSTIRAFGLDVSDTQRVVDVMAKSFSASSLDMEKFTVAMRAVAPVAKNAGFSIEETTALIGTLTDAGVDASTAGTGLRNVFLELSKTGKTFDQAMSEINNATNKNAKSLELFGKRGAVIGTVLAESGVSADALTAKLENAGGAAKEMADKQLNTLGGAVKLLSSAWEGWILKMNDTSGAGSALTSVIKFLAENLEFILDTLVKGLAVFGAYKTGVKAATIATRLFGEAGKKASKFFGGPMLTALTLVALAVVEIVKSFQDAAVAGDAYRKVIEEVNVQMAEEKTKLRLVGIELAKTTAGSVERQQVLDKINAEYGTTLQNLEDEAQFANQVADAYQRIVQNLRKEIEVTVIKDSMIELSKSLFQLEQEQRRAREAGEDSGAVYDLQTKTIGALKDEIGTLENQLIKIQTTSDAFISGKGGPKELADRFSDVAGAIKEVNKALKETEVGFDIDEYYDDFNFGGGIEPDEEEDGFNVPEIDQAIIDENNRLAKKAIDDQEKLNQLRLKQLKEFRDKSMSIIKDITDQVVENIDIRIEARQNEVSVSQSEIQRLQALGTAEANEAIKAERVNQAKQKIEIEKLEKKKKNLLITVTALERASQLIGSGNGNPFANAKAQMNDFLSSLPTFYGGTTGTVADALGSTGTRDGHTVRVHDNEHIISSNDSSALHAAGLTKNSDIVSSALAYQNNAVNKKALGGRTVMSDSRIVSRLDKVEQAINNFEPVKIVQQHIDLATGKEVIIDGGKIHKNNHRPNKFTI